MIDVYGYLGEPGEEVRHAVAGAALVVAGARALDALDVPEQHRVVLGRIGPAIERVQAHLATGAAGRVIVLASGDPLFFGVVRRLRTAGLPCRVRPGVSSVAAAFAAVALPWDDAQVVSAHGHGLAPAVAAARALPKVAVLTEPGHGVREIAAALADLPRWYVVAERLGEADERVRVLDGPAARELADVAQPNVVLVLAAPPDSAQALGQATPYVGGPAPERHRGAEPGGDVGVTLVLGRHLPVLGHTVWTAGALAPPVASWCARTGAAVVPLDRFEGCEVPAHLGDPDLVVLPEAGRLAACFAAHRPRVVAVLATDAAAESTADAVDALDLPDGAAVTVEHLAVTDADGATRTAYLTTIQLPPPTTPQETQ